MTGARIPCAEYLAGLERFGMKPGLERVSALLEACGNPERSFISIHVAGTNGKGSVSAMIESILRAAGFRTGLYTSPHLVSHRERIRLNGSDASDELLDAHAAWLIPAAEALNDRPCGPPTYFEFMTALAFLCFAGDGVKYAVVETGLGGRLDATNVIGAPVVAIPTIALEHEAILGGSLAAIAGEKAAVIREGARVACGAIDGEAMDVISAECARKRATLIRVGDDIIFELLRTSRTGSTMRVRSPGGTYDGLFLPLPGRHQASNCAVAVGAVEGIKAIGAAVSDSAVARGLASVRLRGRLEAIGGKPLLLLDCAHNPAAAAAAASAVAELYPRTRWALVLGVLSDKDIGGICDALVPLASVIVATDVRSARSAPAEEVARACRARTAAEVQVAGGLREALSRSRMLVSAGSADAIFLTGSCYLVGEALELEDEWMGRRGVKGACP